MPKSEGIPAGKKRYTLTLTETTMNRMHSYLGRNHAPKSMISTLVDGFLEDTLETIAGLERAQKLSGGEIGMGELFTVMGKIMTDKNEQGKLL